MTTDSKEEESIEITCEIIKKLHQATVFQNHTFPHLSDWLKILDRNYRQIKPEYISKARALRDKLMQKDAQQVLLHGDLHHNNILQHRGGWGVIDPKGVVGDSTYDLAVFIRNPMPELLANPKAKEIIEGRIKRFAKIMSLSEKDIRDWCFVQSVLSLIWAIEDNGDPEYFERYIQML